jgi:hypothetical protein
MSCKPDFEKVEYGELGVIKNGDGYFDFDINETVFYGDFRSSKGIYFYYFEYLLGLIHDGRLYDCSAGGILVSTYNKVYDYNTFNPCESIEFNSAVLDPHNLYYICPIDCVTQLNDKYTYMKINYRHTIAEGVFTISDEHDFMVKDQNNNKYIAAVKVAGYKTQIKYYYKTYPEFLASLDKKVNIYVANEVIDSCDFCPFEYNHDPNTCEIIECDIQKIYVAICAGKIRLIDGKMAGKSTKAAVRILD